VAISRKQEAEKAGVQKRFGQRLAEIRIAKGITQERFAFQLKVDRTYISYIERGERNPSLYLLWRMAKVLGVKTSNLMDI